MHDNVGKRARDAKRGKVGKRARVAKRGKEFGQAWQGIWASMPHWNRRRNLLEVIKKTKKRRKRIN